MREVFEIAHFSKIPVILRELRTKCKLTQNKVAEILGIDRSTYSYYELGKINPDVKTILHLSRIYGVDYTEILDPEAEAICADLKNEENSKLYSETEDDSDYLDSKERVMLVRLKLLSKGARDEIDKMISDKVQEERKLKKQSDWF